MDSAFSKNNKDKRLFYSYKKVEAPESVLFYNGSKRKSFFTDDSGLYFDRSKLFSRERTKKDPEFKLFDSLNYDSDEIAKRYRKSRGGSEDTLYLQYSKLKRKIEIRRKAIKTKGRSFIERISLIRLWETSMVAAVLVGMISMTFIYRYLGQGVSASSNKVVSEAVQEISIENKSWNKEKEDKYINEIAGYLESKEEDNFNKKAEEMVDGYPIEDMMPYILDKDRDVAAFLIAIAKKESNWGKRVPVLDGKDCYNYWGYRGQRERMGTGGHTCFDSRQDAVNTVAKRINELMRKYDRTTPEKMVVWKCGSDCNATGGQAAANKWISDVKMYMKKLNSSQ